MHFHLPGHVQVCPGSAKVQLNNGILERRHRHWEDALRHFRRAREIEPGYCEPSYWIGITLIATGKDTGLAIQVQNLTCFLRQLPSPQKCIESSA